MPSWAKTLLITVAGAILVVLVALLLVVALLHTSWGLEKTSQKLEGAVSETIPGGMTVGALDDLDIMSPVGTISATANNLIFTHPDGREVVRLDEVRLHFDPFALLSRKIQIEGADIDGGTVTITPGANGRTTLENAFDEGKAKKSGGGGGGARPYTLDFRAMNVENMTLEIPLESKRFELRELQGFVGIFQTRRAPGVTVKFEKMSGVMHEPTYLGDAPEMRHIEGEVLGERDQVVDLAFEAHLIDGRLEGEFAYYPDRDKKVQLTLDPKAELNALAAFVANLRADLGGTVAIDLK